MAKRIKKMVETKIDPELILEACDGDLLVAQFFSEWLSNGRDATKAYSKIHPEVTPGTARVMGSKQLSRVNKALIAESYCVGVDRYFQQLNEGLSADRVTNVGAMVINLGPDHKTRRPYHEAAGKLLGIERDREFPGVQVNVQNVLEGLANE